MRRVYIWDKERKMVVDISSRPVQSAKSPYVIQDSMSPAVHPVDGKAYESKSQFRRVTKAAGCYEMGNDHVPKRSYSGERGLDEAVSRALEEHGHG